MTYCKVSDKRIYEIFNMIFGTDIENLIINRSVLLEKIDAL